MRDCSVLHGQQNKSEGPGEEQVNPKKTTLTDPVCVSVLCLILQQVIHQTRCTALALPDIQVPLFHQLVWLSFHPKKKIRVPLSICASSELHRHSVWYFVPRWMYPSDGYVVCTITPRSTVPISCCAVLCCCHQAASQLGSIITPHRPGVTCNNVQRLTAREWRTY